MDGQRSVLIVDRSEDTREVLQTALQRRGCRILSAGEPRRGLELARRHRPDLIVLDLDLDDAAPEGLSAPFAEQSRANGTPLVLLGTVRRRDPPPAAGEFVAKPYHYGPLVRRIEQLLDTVSQPTAR